MPSPPSPTPLSPSRNRSGLIRRRHHSSDVSTQTSALNLNMHHAQTEQHPHETEQPSRTVPPFDAAQFSAAVAQHVADGIHQGTTNGLSAIVPALLDRLSVGFGPTQPINLASALFSAARPASTLASIPPLYPSGPPDSQVLGQPNMAGASAPSYISGLQPDRHDFYS